MSLSILENSLSNCVILSPFLDELITGQDHEQSECETIYSKPIIAEKWIQMAAEVVEILNWRIIRTSEIQSL